MTHIIKKSLRLKNAKDFIENFNASEHATARNHYIFVGKPLPWTNDESPDAPIDSTDSDFDVWNNMLSTKKIADGYVSLVIPRVNWKTGLVYTAYDSSLDNISTSYVITDEYHIFKCLYNKNGSTSTVKPTLPLSSPYEVTTADEYRWKYLGTLSPTQVDRFLSQSYIPVALLASDDGSNQWDVQAAAVDGAIDSMIIDNKGSSYTAVHTGTLTSATSNTGTLPVGVGVLANGWFNGCSIHITGGTGVGQSPKLITGYNGGTRVITISDTWTADGTTQYQILPTVTISGDGSGAVAKAIVQTSAGADQYKVTRIDMITRGTGYRQATATISGGQGTGAVIHPSISPHGGTGANIERELQAHHVMLSTEIEYEEGSGDFLINGEYRQLGILRNLKNANGTLASASTLLACKTLLLQGVSGTFTPDELITATGGRSGKFIQFISTGGGEGILYYIQDISTGFTAFTQGLVITGGTSNATATIKTSGVVEPEIQRYTSEILTLENRKPVVRSVDQIEQLRFIINF